VEEFARQFQEHVQPIQFGHDNVCDDQIRRPLAVQLKSLTTVGSLRDFIPFRFKSGAEEYADDFLVIDDQNRRHGKNTPVILHENGIPEPGTGAPQHAGGEDQVFPAMVMKKS
jgi:hypothetical protein